MADTSVHGKVAQAQALYGMLAKRHKRGKASPREVARAALLLARAYRLKAETIPRTNSWRRRYLNLAADYSQKALEMYSKGE